MRTFLPLLAVLLLSACGPRTLRVVMNEQNNSGQKGTADITEVSGSEVSITVAITRSLIDSSQPAHVHGGRCGEIDAVKVGLENVVPSPDDTTLAKSLSQRAIAFDELTNGTYAINVHDAADHALYVSCGNIN